MKAELSKGSGNRYLGYCACEGSNGGRCRYFFEAYLTSRSDIHILSLKGLGSGF